MISGQCLQCQDRLMDDQGGPEGEEQNIGHLEAGVRRHHRQQENSGHQRETPYFCPNPAGKNPHQDKPSKQLKGEVPGISFR